MSTSKQPPRRRVLVVGAGAAGTACAWSLSRHPDKFEVHVWEALPVPGGVASSCVLKDGRVLNDQVQGGAPSYRHNLMLLEMHGFKPTPVMMRIAFGVGDKQWTNHSPSPLTERLQPEIDRFGRLLKWVARFEPIFIFVPIVKLLRMWGFSDDFRNQMVFPLVALFFGTGNQTPNVSAAVISRVFLDPDLRLFDYCPQRLLNSVPQMFAFPVLQDVFTTIAARSPYQLHCNRPVARVVRDGKGVTATDAAGVQERFDEIVFACDAETVLRVLAEPTRTERRLLSSVTYYTDYCVTHDDGEYMARMYDLKLEQQDNYFVRTYPSAPEKIEMSFNLSTYQPHLSQQQQTQAGGGPATAAPTPPPPVYQTYYLDIHDRGLWSDKQVAPDKVLAKRWMRQFAHTWRHFAFFVPWARFMQGTKHTWYAGSYTLINTQEIAVMSGLAAAERLGADYPFPHDPLAASQFDTYLFVAHGARRRSKGDKKAAAAAAEAFRRAVEAVAAEGKQVPGAAASAAAGVDKGAAGSSVPAVSITSTSAPAPSTPSPQRPSTSPVAVPWPLGRAEVTTASVVRPEWGIPEQVVRETLGPQALRPTPPAAGAAPPGAGEGAAGLQGEQVLVVPGIPAAAGHQLLSHQQPASPAGHSEPDDLRVTLVQQQQHQSKSQQQQPIDSLAPSAG